MQSPTQNVLAPEPPLTRFQAQRKLGLFAASDFAILFLILCAWVVLGFWKLFGNPELKLLLAAALLSVVLMQVWVVILIYRCMVFVLDLHADISLMPEAAARIVVGFWEGRRAK